ncbi:hypothetical protein N0V90_006509 [Kalmusia sp. IMI 367209]|nr:hypothetical protein N0V90_006509 [Kalmusia sp. IMI 367209]
MDLNKPRTYGKSTSMPLLPSYMMREVEHDSAMQQSWQQVLDEIQLSPSYQVLLASDASTQVTRHRDAAVLPTDISYTDTRSESESSISPRSDDTVKPGDVLRSDDITDNRTSSDCWGQEPSSEKRIKCGVASYRRPAHGSASQLSPCAPVFQPMVTLGNDPNLGLYKSAVEQPKHRSGLNECSLHQNSVDSRTASAFDDFETGSALKSSGGFVSMDRVGAPNAMRPNFHHRRISSKLSFTPVLPSPLGPGQYTNDLGSDVSGLVMPTPATAPSNQTQNAQWHNGPTPRTTAMASPAAIPFSYTQSTAKSYSPFDMSDISDPFVDRRRPLPPVTPGFTPHRRKAATPITPRHPEGPQNHRFTHFAPSTSQDHNSLLLPPLPVAQLVCKPSPESRARIDAQKALRESWIRTEAHKIASLARSVSLLKQKYSLTQSQADYAAYMHACSLLEDATNLDKRMEERRNLTLPPGMSALKTGPNNLPGDGMRGQSGEGRLLGFRMALMERICAESRGKEDKCMMPVEELTPWGKNTIRKAVVRDIEKAVRRRG